MRALDPEGVDFVFDAVGAPETTALALRWTRGGGTAVVVGLPAGGREAELDPLDFTNREKTLTGTIYGSEDPAVALPRLLDLVRAGELELGGLVGPSFPLERADDAFQASLAGRPAACSSRRRIAAMTSLSLYEDLLGAGRVARSCPREAGWSTWPRASSRASTPAAPHSATTRPCSSRGRRSDGAPLGADGVVGRRREALGPRRARPVGRLRDALRARRRRRAPGPESAACSAASSRSTASSCSRSARSSSRPRSPAAARSSASCSCARRSRRRRGARAGLDPPLSRGRAWALRMRSARPPRRCSRSPVAAPTTDERPLPRRRRRRSPRPRLRPDAAAEQPASRVLDHRASA